MHGADMKITDLYKQTALMHALYGHYFDAKIEDPKNQRISTPLTVSLLLSFKTNINAQDYKGRTALMIALQQKLPIEIIQLLLENGADATLHDKQGQDALVYAREAGVEYEKLLPNKTEF